MKYFTITVFSFFILIFGSLSSYGNFIPVKLNNQAVYFVSKHKASKIELKYNITVVLQESNLEVEEEFNFNNDLNSNLFTNHLIEKNNISKINCDFEALFDLNIFNNYFKNLPIIISHNPLYLSQSVFLI